MRTVIFSLHRLAKRRTRPHETLKLIKSHNTTGCVFKHQLGWTAALIRCHIHVVIQHPGLEVTGWRSYFNRSSRANISGSVLRLVSPHHSALLSELLIIEIHNEIGQAWLVFSVSHRPIQQMRLGQFQADGLSIASMSQGRSRALVLWAFPVRETVYHCITQTGTRQEMLLDWSRDTGNVKLVKNK